MTDRHAKIIDIFCPVCHIPSNSIMEKVLHVNFKHPFLVPDGKISCSECQRQLNRGSIGPHIRSVHFGLKTYKCDKCDKAFVDSSKLKKHAIVHSDERKFQCEKCEAKFKTKQQKEVHERDVHTEGSGEICPHCGAAFKSKRYLNAHLKYMHTEYPLIYCDKCGKGFKTQVLLRGHIKQVHEKIFVVCDDCGKVFESQNRLNQHVKAVHQKKKPFICPYEGCSRDFKWKSNLKLHIQTVHDKVPLERKLICPFCMKKFEDEESLKIHKDAAHANTKEIKCEQCDWTTNFPPHLKLHIESVHLGIMYDCDYPGCTKSFNKKWNLNIHKSTVHNLPKPSAKFE